MLPSVPRPVSRSLRSVAQYATKSAAVGFDVVRPPTPGVLFLTYHRVGSGAAQELDVPAGVFDAQMAHLARTGRAVSIDVALQRSATPVVPSGPDPVVVTFDDGTVDFIDHAVPALVRHGVPAVMYIATDFIERQRPFPYDGAPLSWSALAEAVSTGLVTVGSHTHTHAVMDHLGPDQAEDELRRSIQLIEDRLGVPAWHFAYPKGVAPGAEVEAVVRHHFRSAALCNSGTNPYGATDPHRLERTPIQRSDHGVFFRRKLDHGLRLEGELRRRLNERRYAGLAN